MDNITDELSVACICAESALDNPEQDMHVDVLELISQTLNGTDGSSSQEHESHPLLWTPHIFLTVILLSLIIASFFTRARERDTLDILFGRMSRRNALSPFLGRCITTASKRMKMQYTQSNINHALADMWREQLLKRSTHLEKMAKSQKYKDNVHVSSKEAMRRRNFAKAIISELDKYLDETTKKKSKVTILPALTLLAKSKNQIVPEFDEVYEEDLVIADGSKRRLDDLVKVDVVAEAASRKSVAQIDFGLTVASTSDVRPSTTNTELKTIEQWKQPLQQIKVPEWVPGSISGPSKPHTIQVDGPAMPSGEGVTTTEAWSSGAGATTTHGSESHLEISSLDTLPPGQVVIRACGPNNTFPEIYVRSTEARTRAMSIVPEDTLEWRSSSERLGIVPTVEGLLGSMNANAGAILSHNPEETTRKVKKMFTTKLGSKF